VRIDGAVVSCAVLVAAGVPADERRTRVAGLFPGEASLLRMVSAVLSETSEEWETGKIYLSTEGMPA